MFSKLLGSKTKILASTLAFSILLLVSAGLTYQYLDEGRGGGEGIHVESDIVFVARKQNFLRPTLFAFSHGEDEVLWGARAHGGLLQNMNPLSVRAFPRDVHSAGQYLASAGSDGSVELREARTGNLIWRHRHHDDSVWEVSIRDDIVVSSGRDGRVVAAGLEDGALFWSHTAHYTGDPRTQMIRSVRLDDTGVFSAGYDGQIILSDASTGETIWRYRHGGRIKSVDHSDGVVVFSSWEADADVVAISLESSDVLWTHAWHDRSAAGFRGDHLGVEELMVYGDKVYSAGDDGRVVVANLFDGSIVGYHDRHSSSVRSIFVNDDGVFSIDRDGTVIFSSHVEFDG